MDAAGLARSLEDTQALADRKARFGELGTFINTARRLEDLLPGVQARLLPIFDADRSTLFAVDPSNNELYSLIRFRMSDRQIELRVATLPTVNANEDVVMRRGCEACGGSGYKGRIGLHELLVNDDKLKHAIARRAPVEELRQLAAAGGMTTLLQDGITKALAGKTDLKQVLAVCSR